jgi:hypothetical protein
MRDGSKQLWREPSCRHVVVLLLLQHVAAAAVLLLLLPAREIFVSLSRFALEWNVTVLLL